MKNTKRFAVLEDIKALPVKDKYQFNSKNAVELIKNAIAAGQQIHIRGDYDVDGISAMAILLMAIEKLGGNVEARAPLRFSEGFGLSESMVNDIESGLLITVDNGIVAYDAAKKARAKGLKVLITDHHMPNTKGGEVVLPEADCIINPHVEGITGESGYDFFDYCGAGLTLKIAEELLNGSDQQLLDKLYAFAAIATIADVMPLVEDNRKIVTVGFEAMRKGNITDGLYQLLFLNKIEVNSLPDTLPAYMAITTTDIGFKIAPCSNAMSRMNDDGAATSLKCFVADGDNTVAKNLANELYITNEQRKAQTTQEMAAIENMIVTGNMKEDCPLIVYLPDAKEGLIGLDAGRLAEEYGVPAIVICGQGTCKGSARNPNPNISIKAMLDILSSYLVRYGGHSGAAGLSIKEEDISSFREAFKALCEKEGIGKLSVGDLEYDLEITPNQLGDAYPRIVEMGPYGEGNTEPVFLIKGFKPNDIKIIKDKHIKLLGSGYQAIGFNLLEPGTECNLPETVDLIATLEYNIFRGAAIPQINIKAILDGEDVLYRSDK